MHFWYIKLYKFWFAITGLNFLKGGNCLHTGTRKGEIHIFDMRSRSTFPVTTLQHKSSVCSINLVNNDTHLIGADFTGKV